MGETNDPAKTIKNDVEIKTLDMRAESLVGGWLCEDGKFGLLNRVRLSGLRLPCLGDYRRYIEAMSGSNPGLKRPDPMNEKKHPLIKGNALVVLLESPATSPPDFSKHEFVNVSTLRKHFQERKEKPPARRIYIMEGLAQDFINVLGSHFFMDPSFFLRQERTCVWSNDFTPTSDALSQPSLLMPKTMFHLQYCELRQFSRIVQNQPFFCKRTGM